jgi:glucose-6-phosphate 1-dehydrogenase
MPDSLVVLGIGGDLGGRYLLPALAELERLERLPSELPIIGTGRDEWNDDDLRSYAEEQLAEHDSDDAPNATEARRRLLQRLRYRQVDVTEEDEVRAAIEGSGSPVVYLALPPSLFEPTIDALGRATEEDRASVVVEKPFGSDVASARRLNEVLHRHFSEDRILRVDHFLHLQTVQNVLALRFANRFLEPLWDSRHIESVEIVWDETLALEGRAGYYDDAGALKDVVQNHLLQLFCLVAMEPPTSIEGPDVRARKVDVLRAVRQFSDEDVERRTVRGRYTAGAVEGKQIPAYVEEEGVEADQCTETFAQVTLAVDNWRWAGVPFTLRTGKAMAANRHEIRIRFRPVPHLAFGERQTAEPNVLRLGVEPDTVELSLMVSGGTAPDALEPARMDLALGEQDISAYGRVLLDAIEGRTGMSIGPEEAEEAWRVFEPVLDSWQRGRPPLLEYPAGSDGPAEASSSQ